MADLSELKRRRFNKTPGIGVKRSQNAQLKETDSSLSDLKELRGKRSVQAAGSPEPETKTGEGPDRFSNLSALKAKRSPRDYHKLMQTEIQSVLGKISNYSQDISNAYATYSFEDFKNSGDLISRGQLMGQDVDRIRTYLRNYGGVLDVEYVSSITQALDDAENYRSRAVDALSKQKSTYEQFSSEQQYLDTVEAYERSQKERQAVLDFDTSAGQSEVEDIDAQISALKAKQGKLRRGSYQKGGLTKEEQEQEAAYADEIAKLHEQLVGKKAYLNRAKRIQEGVRLAGVADRESEFYDPDFESYTEYQATGLSSLWDFATTHDDAATHYEYINNPENREAISKMPVPIGTEEYNFRDLAAHMTEEEKRLYNYHYNHTSPENAEKYFYGIADTLAARAADKTAESLKGNYLGEIAYSGFAGYERFLGDSASGFRALAGDDRYVAPSSTQVAAAQVREDLANLSPELWYNIKTGRWEDKIAGNTAGQIAADAATNITNMAPSIGASVIANMILPGSGAISAAAVTAGSAGGGAYQEAINMGYDVNSARNYGFLVGGSEAALQYALSGLSYAGGKLSGNVVSKISSNINNGLLRTAVKWGGSMASEFTEEYLQEVLTPVFQNWALKMDNDVNFLSSDAAYAGFLGALTAGLFEGPGIVAEGVNNYTTGKALRIANITGHDMSKLGQLPGLDSASQQLAGRINESTGAYTMGRLFNEVSATVTPNDLTAIEQRLVDAGVTEEHARILAEAFATVVAGGQFTQEQARALDANNTLAKAVQETALQQTAEEPAFTEAAQGSPAAAATAAENVTGQESQAPQIPGWKPGQRVASLDDMGREYMAFYDAGFRGAAVENVNTDAWNGHSISAEQKVEAWKAGQKAAAESFVKGQKTAFVNYGKDGKVIYSKEGIQLKKSDRNTYQQLENLAKGWGVNIEIGTFSEWENGSIQDGVIRINAQKFTGENRQRVVAKIFAHEVTHRMQETSVEAYTKYRDFALEAVSRKGVNKLQEEITVIQDRYAQKGVELTREEAMDEIAANFTENFLQDTKMFQEFITESEDHRTIGKWLIDSAKAIIEWIKKTFASRSDRNAAALRETGYSLDTLENAVKLWEQAYKAGKKAVKNAPVRQGTGDGKIGHSVSASENEFLYNVGDFSYQVDNISKIPAGEAMVVCGTPQVFVDIGLNRLPMTLNLEHAKDAITLNPNHKDRYIGKTALKDLPRALEEPVAIIASASHSATSLVAIVDLKGQNGKSVIVPVYLNGMSKAHGIRMDVNAISSAHERRNAISGLLMGAIKEEMNGNIRVFYMDNKKANQLIRGEGLQLPNSFMSMNGFNHSIFEDGSPVKGHFKEIAQANSKQFKRWFGKSKVVNENGTPLVVYHGTDAEFTSFDMSKGRANMDIQGAFFSPYQDDARGYGNNVGAFYLSIQNPADESTAYKALSRFKGQNNAGVKARDYLIKQGYDGVYNGYDEYIAFYPSQIKSATQNIGTFDKQNPDTRYSVAGNLLSDAQNAALKAAEDKYGTIKPGEKPHRQAPVPRRMEKEKKVSMTIRTALEAGATPEMIVPQIADSLIEGNFSDAVLSNEKLVKKARAWVKSHASTDAALVAWSEKTGKEDLLSVDAEAQGYLLYNQLANAAANSNDVQEQEKYAKQAIYVLTGIINRTRTAARMVQATRILKRMAPEGRYYSLQRAVNNLNAKLLESTSDLELVGGRTHIEIDQNLAAKWVQYLHNGDVENAEAVEEKLYQSIAKQVKRTWMDKWNAWRYLSMLGNFKTLTRNLVGNLAMNPVKFTKDRLGAVMEGIFVRDRSKRTKYFGSTHTTKGKAVRDFAKQDYSNVQELLRSQSKYNDSSNQKLMAVIRDYKSKFQAPILRQWQQAVDWVMNGDVIGDTAFMRHHYTNSFAQIALARGWTAEQIKSGAISQEQVDWARATAFREAQKATFRDINAFSSAIRKLRFKGKSRASKVGNIFLEGVLPFRGTPANVLVRAIEYSPVELLVNSTIGTYDLVRGKIDAGEYIDRMASGLTGSAIFALGMFLAGMGLVTGGEDDDDKERMGYQKYSLNVGGKSYSLDWLTPVSIPFFMGVASYSFVTEPIISGDGFDIGAAISAVSGAFQPILEMSCLSSMNSLLDTMTYGDGADAGQIIYAFFVNPFISYLGQGIPTLLNQTATSLEKQGEKTFVSDIENQFTRNVMYDLLKLAEKIPGHDWRQVPRVDAWGRVDEGTGTSESFFSPAYINDIQINDADREIERLQELFQKQIDRLNLKLKNAKGYSEKSLLRQQIASLQKLMNISPDVASTKIGNIRLTQDEYTEYALVKGENNYHLVTGLLTSTWYQSLTDEQKSKAITKVLDLADARGKYAAVGLLDDYDEYLMDSDLATTLEFVQTKLEENWQSAARTAANRALKDALAHGVSTKPAVDALKASGASDETVQSNAKTYIKELYGYGEIDDTKAIGYLKNFGLTGDEAVDQVTYWKFQTECPSSKLPKTAALCYWRSLKDSGVKLEDFEIAYTTCQSFDAKNENEETVNRLKKQRVEQYLTSLKCYKAALIKSAVMNLMNYK